MKLRPNGPYVVPVVRRENSRTSLDDIGAPMTISAQFTSHLALDNIDVGDFPEPYENELILAA